MRNKLIRQTALLLAAVLTVGSAYTGQVVDAKETAQTKAGTSVSLASELSEGDTTGQEEVPTKETESPSEDITGETQSGETVSGETESATEVPTTEPLTTAAPTTEVPTTAAPTTEVPTTADYEIIDGLYKVKQGTLIEYLGNKTDVNTKTITIPASVVKIDKSVFTGYKYIETVNFAANSKLTELGDYAFKDCTALKTIVLPEGVTTLGNRAFGNCTSLTEFKIPSTVTSGSEIFGTKNSVTKVVFAKGMVTVPQQILKYAYSVQSVELPEGIKTLSYQAFYHCTGLKSIALPSTVTTINKSVFNGCTALTSVSMSSAVKTIKDYAFKKCTSLKTLEIPKSTTTIGTLAFSGDTNLTLLVYANSKGKAFARANKIKWDFTDSEKKRQATNTAIYNKYMKQVKAKHKSKFNLKYLANYVPQGTCAIGKYLVVSMYQKNLAKNSILVVYNRTSGAFVKKLVIPAKDHVGAVTNVEGRLVISLNNISATDYIAVVSYSRLNSTKNGKTLKYNYRVKLPGYADFAAYDGTVFWAGRSANVSNATMQGYKVKIKKGILTFTKKYSYTVPANTQGLIVQKTSAKSSKRTFIIAQSYGRLNNSKLYTYSAKISKAKTLGKAKTTKTLPAMLEGIAMTSKGYIFMVYESGAGLYCGDPDNTSEIQINNVCQIKYTKLSKLQ